jgi:hypothetical protein
MIESHQWMEVAPKNGFKSIRLIEKGGAFE